MMENWDEHIGKDLNMYFCGEERKCRIMCHGLHHILVDTGIGKYWADKYRHTVVKMDNAEYLVNLVSP